MSISRRNFLGTAAAASIAASVLPRSARAANPPLPEASNDALERAAAQPVLDRSLFKSAVIIESIDTLKLGRDTIIRVRSKDGAEGIAIDNGRFELFQPILSRLILPYFIGKDARDFEDDSFGVYRNRDNYKFQGLVFWSAFALVEFAVLDLLGRIANKSIHQLLGRQVRDRAAFYIASGRRDTTPEQEVEHLQRLLAETGAKAVKYRLGGRMNRNIDAMPGRTEKLIPLTRKVLGDKIAIHGDANSSYDATEAIRIGRMLEDINAVYFEEPCPFDDFYATKKVTDALTIPVALGEQEFSEARFRDCIRDRVADIVQPDLFYYGGLIRSIRVARMAALREMPTTVHISGGFGFVYMLHFAAVVPRIGDYQEYKEGVKAYGSWFKEPLQIVDGALMIPTGPGVGIADPAAILKDARPLA